MKRRTFLKILGVVPVIAVAPKIVAKEKLTPAYFNGTEFRFKPKNQNTGATLNIDDLGEKPIVKVNGGEIKPLQEFTITAKDIIPLPDYKPFEIANDSYLDNWAILCGISRKPFETDACLRKRILKIRRV